MFTTFRLQAAVAVMLVALAGCTTMQNQPAPQTMAALPQASSGSIGVMPPSMTQPLPPPLVETFEALPPDRVYFEYDKSDLDATAIMALQKQAAWLGSHNTVALVIEGYSDERGTREYNLALAARRAAAVRTYLIMQGIGAARLETISCGKERPVCAGSDEACWKLNRRAVSAVNA